jgi:AAA domain
MATLRSHADPWESGDPGPPDGWDLARSEVPQEPAWLPPEVLTARDVCGLPLPEGQEVLGALIMVAGRVVIGGKSGEGKTTIVMQMVRATADGAEFLGFKGCGGRVLVLDLEQGLRTVQRRLRESGLDENEMVDYARIPDGLDLIGSEQQREWLEALIVGKGYAMVVLDPLYKAHQGDSNDERMMVDLMRRLDRLRDDHQFALVIPMHLRKMTERQTTVGMDDIFGSGGLTRGAEVVLGIRKLAPGRSMLYFWKDRDGDLQEHDKWPLEFNVEHGFTRAPIEPEIPVDVLVIRAFTGSGKDVLTRQEIVVFTGKSDRTVRDAIARCLERGDLRETGTAGAHGRKMYTLGALPEEETMRYERLAMEDWDV